MNNCVLSYKKSIDSLNQRLKDPLKVKVEDGEPTFFKYFVTGLTAIISALVGAGSAYIFQNMATQ
jgi:hypothetical protein